MASNVEEDKKKAMDKLMINHDLWKQIEKEYTMRLLINWNKNKRMMTSLNQVTGIQWI